MSGAKSAMSVWPRHQVSVVSIEEMEKVLTYPCEETIYNAHDDNARDAPKPNHPEHEHGAHNRRCQGHIFHAEPPREEAGGKAAHKAGHIHDHELRKYMSGGKVRHDSRRLTA